MAVARTRPAQTRCRSPTPSLITLATSTLPSLVSVLYRLLLLQLPTMSHESAAIVFFKVPIILIITSLCLCLCLASSAWLACSGEEECSKGVHKACRQQGERAVQQAAVPANLVAVEGKVGSMRVRLQHQTTTTWRRAHKVPSCGVSGSDGFLHGVDNSDGVGAVPRDDTHTLQAGVVGAGERV